MRKNQAGVTLIEVMVSGAVLLIVAAAVGQQLLSFKKFSVRQKELDAEAMMVQSVLDQVQARIEVYPKSFTPLGSDQYPSDLGAMVSSLQASAGAGWAYAWSKDFFGPKDQCTLCPGRAFFNIEQLKVCSNPTTCGSNPTGDLTQYYLGLYKVRLVLYHPTLFSAPIHAKQYYFLVGSR